MPFPPPGELLNPGIKPTSPVSLALQADSLPAELPGKTHHVNNHGHITHSLEKENKMYKNGTVLIFIFLIYIPHMGTKSI